MSLASRHGKLASPATGDSDRWRREEDLLTADVLGALRFLPTALGARPVLAEARAVTGESLPEWLAAEGVPFFAADSHSLWFWPRLAGREPDAVVLLASGGTPLVSVLVEAKLNATQHDIEGRCQLAHYALQHSQRRYADDELIASLTGACPIIYLTRHETLPVEEMRRAASETRTALSCARAADESLVEFFWLNWQTIHDVMSGLWKEVADRADAEPWLGQLQEIVLDLEARGLRPPRSLQYFPLPEGLSLPILERTGRLQRLCRTSVRRARAFADLGSLRLGGLKLRF